jgi:hypothetical protein
MPLVAKIVQPAPSDLSSNALDTQAFSFVFGCGISPELTRPKPARHTQDTRNQPT